MYIGRSRGCIQGILLYASAMDPRAGGGTPDSLDDLRSRCAELREESRRLAEKLAALNDTIEQRVAESSTQLTPEETLSKHPNVD